MSDGRPMVVGMIGVGGFGKYRRARMRDTALFRVSTCYDRDPAALAVACREEGAIAAASVDELLAAPGLEGLVVSTGVDTHAELACRAMAAGLHVFVEKPLCGRIEDIPRLLEARRRSGRVVAMGHVDCAADSICRMIRQYLGEDRLGTLVCYEYNTSHSGGLEIKAGDWRGLRDRNPGGMLLQCGVHALHAINHLFGPIAQVSAMMRYDANPVTQTADAANVLIRHSSGLLGTVNAYHVTAYCHEFRLFGTKANLYIDTHDRCAFLQERRNNLPEQRGRIDIPECALAEACANLVNWYRAVRNGSMPGPSLEDGIDAVLPVFAAERADAEKCAVALGELRQRCGHVDIAPQVHA